MITLRFIADRSIESKLIRWFSWSDYSHVEFVVNGGYLGACLKGGVQVRPLDYCQPFREEICQLDVSGEAIIETAMKQVGKPYSWKGILAIIFRLNYDWRNQNRWFCSEFVAWACEQGGKPLLRMMEADRLTPGDVWSSPLLKTISSGPHV